MSSTSPCLPWVAINSGTVLSIIGVAVVMLLTFIITYILPKSGHNGNRGGVTRQNDPIEHRQNLTLLVFPDTVLLLIAQFITPPDAYSLCLTNKARFGALKDPPLFCKRILRSSLLSSLDYVMRKSKARGISLSNFEFMKSMPPGSVVITGSTMVQCVIGEVWEDTDIDIFCIPSAAPTVRSFLVKDAKQLFTGFRDNYIGVANLGRTFFTKIHHVEHYCNAPSNGSSGYYNSSVHYPAFSYQRACVYGRSINQSCFPRPWQQYLCVGSSDEFNDPNYHIKTLNHDEPLPFDYNYSHDTTEHNISPYDVAKRDIAAFDLVVAKTECNTAKDLLCDIDLSICKVTWDGNTFTIPDPHFSFNRGSKIEPKRRSLVESYQRHYVMGDDKLNHDSGLSHMSDNERLQRMRLAMEKIHGEIYLSENDLGSVVARDLGDLAMHNFIFMLVDRLRKYERRGIQVDSAPDTSNFSIRGFTALDMPDDLWAALLALDG